MKTTVCALVMVSQLFLGLAANADDYPDAATIAQINHNWRCQWCPQTAQSGEQREIDGGLGYQSNDSFRYGDYSGLDSKGVYALVSARYRNEDEHGSVSAQAEDLGLRSRSLSVSMDNQSVSANLDYNAIPHLLSDSARTPYTGGELQTLPSNWVKGGSPQAMSALGASLNDVELYQVRRNLTVSAQTKPSNGVQYAAEFQQQRKSGAKSAGVAVGAGYGSAKSVLLAIPIDNVTRQGEISATYKRGKVLANAAYSFSQFNNRLDYVRFDYAYDSPTIAAAQISLEPDNQMQRLSLSAQYQHAYNHISSAQLAVAQATQSQRYLPYSLSANLYPSDSSLDARINYFDANIKHAVSLNEQMQLSFQYHDSEQDNNSDRQQFAYEIADSGSLASPARSNMPFSFRTQRVSAAFDYNLAASRRSLAAILNITQHDRTYQSVSKSRDSELVLSAKSPLATQWQLRGKLSSLRRHGDAYTALSVSDLPSPENAAMRAYHLADGTINSAALWVTYTPRTGFELALQSRRQLSDYDADLGVREASQLFHGVSLDYAITPMLRLNGGLDYVYTRSLQAGSTSSTSSTANWMYELINRDQQARLGLHYRPKLPGLGGGVEWALLNSRLLADNTFATAFPDASLRRHTVLLYADYDINNRDQIHGYYRYQKYNEDNWQRDALAIDSLGQVLTLGEQSPVYDIGFIAISYRHQF